MLDQQQLQDYEANARSSAQPENLPENEMLLFHERQNPERPELRGRPINFGFIDKILQVNIYKLLEKPKNETTNSQINQFTNLKCCKMSFKAFKMKKQGLKCFCKVINRK